MSTTLIVGAGRLGTLVAARRRAAGDRVLTVNRNYHPMPHGTLQLRADVTSVDAFAHIEGPIDRVVYCVGPDRRSIETYRQCFVLGLSHLIGWLRAQPGRIPRLLFVSSTAVYGQQLGEWVDEESETLPLTALPNVLLEAETLVRGYGAQGLTLRLAGLYGDSPSLIERLLREPLPDRAYHRFVNRIHLQDAAAAVEHLLLLNEPLPLYLGADAEPATEQTVCDWLSELLGTPKRRLPDLPRSEMAPNKRCRNSRLLESGFVFRFPTFRDGYRELAERTGLLASSTIARQ